MARAAVWPKVRERVAEWRAVESAREPPPRALVVEVPLLFEAGQASAYDATIAVVADDALRAERAGARGHEAVDERTARQLPQQKGGACDVRRAQLGHPGRVGAEAVVLLAKLT